MKKQVCLIFVLLLLVGCGPKQQKVEKYMEGGVEVVVNHLEPYEFKGGPASLKLEEEFAIDTERNDIAEKGLTDISAFDVDSEGNIYFLDSKGKDSFIFKFDNHGKFVSSFARKGQGPGELQTPRYFMIDDQDQLTITDIAKLILLRKDGNLLREVPLYVLKKGMVRIAAIEALSNGNYLISRVIINPNPEYLREEPLSLYGPDFREMKELGRQKIPNFDRQSSKRVSFFALSWNVSDQKIYIADRETDYEIGVYDFEGHLMRKIRQEFKPADSEEYRKTILKLAQELGQSELFNKLQFPSVMPPYQYLFSDDKGRLFVMTYEKGQHPDEHQCDIFDQAGIFIGKASLKYYQDWQSMPRNLLKAKARNDRIYCPFEKENGFKKLTIYKLKWTK